MEKIMSYFQKKFLSGSLALLLANSPLTLAGFKIIEEGDAPKPLDPVQVITVAHENEKLHRELERLTKELERVKSILEFARTDSINSRKELLIAKAKLESIETNMSKVIVPFAFDKTEFIPQPSAAEKIVAFAKSANSINVRGYTDSIGPSPVNQRIALLRAIAAKRYLLSKGVEEAKIQVHGHTGGYVASNLTESGRLANRRVEIEFQE